MGARSTFSPKTTSLFLSLQNLIFFFFSKLFFCHIRFFFEYVIHWISALGDKETLWQWSKKWLQVLWLNELKKIWSVFCFLLGGCISNCSLWKASFSGGKKWLAFGIFPLLNDLLSFTTCLRGNYLLGDACIKLIASIYQQPLYKVPQCLCMWINVLTGSTLSSVNSAGVLKDL